MLYPIQTRVKSNNNEIKQSKDNGIIILSNSNRVKTFLKSNNNEEIKQRTMVLSNSLIQFKPQLNPTLQFKQSKDVFKKQL